MEVMRRQNKNSGDKKMKNVKGGFKKYNNNKKAFAEYTIPDPIKRRLKLFGYSENFDYEADMQDWLLEIDRTLGIHVELNHNTAIEKEMIEYTQEFKDEFYMHYISILAYKVDEYYHQEHYTRMIEERYNMMEEFKKTMRNFIL